MVLQRKTLNTKKKKKLECIENSKSLRFERGLQTVNRKTQETVRRKQRDPNESWLSLTSLLPSSSSWYLSSRQAMKPDGPPLLQPVTHREQRQTAADQIRTVFKFIDHHLDTLKIILISHAKCVLHIFTI